jgi:hypothetical protein
VVVHGGTRQFEVATALAGPLLPLLPAQTELFKGDFIVASVTVVGLR